MRKFLLALTASLLCATSAQALEKRTLCVYDPSGQSGDMFNIMKDYRTAAVEWGVEFELNPYKNEKEAGDDLLAGKCDGALITGVRGRSIHPFAGTIEALGALPDYNLLKQAINYSADPRVAGDMRKDNWEVAAIYPAGLVHLFVRDKAMNSIDQLKGKKISTMDFDEAATTMISSIGATIEKADLNSFAKKFNDGVADIAYAPAYAYKALELSKGVGTKGGIIRYPLAQLTMQLILKSDKFDPEFGQKSREYAKSKFAVAKDLATKSEKQIPANVWIDISPEDQAKYDAMLLEVRLKLRDQQKIYNAKALKTFAKLRCKADPNRPECADKKE